jgi:NADH dehydrogenase
MARPRIVIVGAGFAGYHAARTLLRLSRGRAEIALVNPMDYFLYLPLLPEVAAGVIDPRRVAVSLPETLPGARLIGEADRIDLNARRLSLVDPEERRGDWATTGSCSPSAASTSCCTYREPTNTPTAFGASPRRCTCATT